MSSTTKKPSSPNPLRFSPIPVAVLKDNRIPDGPKVLLGIILDYAWSDTSTWVSVGTLALDARRSVRTIQMWLSCLKGHRWIRVEPDKSVPTGRRIVLAWRDRGSGDGEAGTVGDGVAFHNLIEPERVGRNLLHSQDIAPDL